jgi:hypothetical protein
MWRQVFNLPNAAPASLWVQVEKPAPTPSVWKWPSHLLVAAGFQPAERGDCFALGAGWKTCTYTFGLEVDVPPSRGGRFSTCRMRRLLRFGCRLKNLHLHLRAGSGGPTFS